jgi:two-component system, OmpR family, phosphate regulon response regulator PhoB
VQPTRILVVEDEEDLAGLLKHTLERSLEATVHVARSGEGALKAVAEEHPHLIILDLNLPILDGIDVCRILRARATTADVPIIMLTARSGEADRVAGFEVGADDYVTKPFSLRELTARVRAVLRRRETRTPAEASQNQRVYRGNRLAVDFDAVAVTVDDAHVRLTRREFELLRFFLQNRNRLLSRDRLIERVWGYDLPVETRSVDVHVARLRSKLGPAGDQIETVIGMGYRFIELPPTISPI